MKYKLIIKAAQLNKLLQYSLMLLGLFILPALASAQSTPPPPTGSGGTGNGGIPDSPLSVPFDNRLSLLLLLAGVVLALVVMKEIQKKKVLSK